MKLKLASNWKKLHKSFTVLLGLAGSVVGLIEVILPQMGIIQPFMEPSTYGMIMFGMSVAVAVGRYIQQDCLKEKKYDQTPE